MRSVGLRHEVVSSLDACIWHVAFTEGSLLQLSQGCIACCIASAELVRRSLFSARQALHHLRCMSALACGLSFGPHLMSVAT